MWPIEVEKDGEQRRKEREKKSWDSVRGKKRGEAGREESVKVEN